MDKISRGAQALILFSVMSILMVGIYDGMQQDYGFTPDTNTINGTATDVNIMQAFSNLLIVQGFDEVVNVFRSDAASEQFDLLGKLAAGGLGTINIIVGVFIFPFQIGTIVVQYFNVPQILVNGVLILMIISLIFIITKLVLGRSET